MITQQHDPAAEISQMVYFFMSGLTQPLITDEDELLIAKAVQTFISVRPVDYYRHDPIDLLFEFVNRGQINLDHWRYVINGGGAYYHTQ